MEQEMTLRQTILRLVDGFMDASIKKDVIFMQQYLNQKFLFATPRGTLFNYETFFSDFILNEKIVLLQFERLQQQVISMAGLALMNGIAKAQFQGADQQFERISFLWIPGDQSWSLLHIHSTFTSRPL